MQQQQQGDLLKSISDFLIINSRAMPTTTMTTIADTQKQSLPSWLPLAALAILGILVIK